MTQDPDNSIVSLQSVAPAPPAPSQQAGQPLQDPRSHPATRVAGEGLVTAGRGMAPNAWTSAGMQR